MTSARRIVGGALLLIGAVVFAAVLGDRSGAAADPSHYAKKSTWQETHLASLEALARQGVRDEFEPFESEILRGGDAPKHIRVDVSGAQEMYLFVTGDPDVIWGVADWADPRLVANDGREQPLTNVAAEGPGTPALDWKVLNGRHDVNITLHSGLYEPLRMGGRQFARGIHVQANSEIRVPLEGKYARFEAWVGVDSWAKKNGTVRFSVLSRKSAARKELWDLLARDFPEDRPRREMRWEQRDRIHFADWRTGDFGELARRYAEACRRVPSRAEEVVALASNARDRAGLAQVRARYYRVRETDEALARLREFNFKALRLALEDLTKTCGEKYAKGAEYLARLSSYEKDVPQALAGVGRGSREAYARAAKLSGELEAFRREALLANPLLDFDRLLLIRRTPDGDPRRSQWGDRGLGVYIGLPQQSSWGIATIAKPNDWDNEIAVLSPVRPEGRLTTLYKPEGRKLVTDVDLHWDADKLLFSMPGSLGKWQVFELGADGKGLRQVTPGDQPDVHNYDAFYLPNGRIGFISTAALQGVPCNAGVIVGMMYLMDRAGKSIRQVCFEQDHDYTPSILNNGRILYLRWDYTDTPHVWNRLLMEMNPDGTGQMEYYGSNSYWPNAVFFARAIPNHASKVVGIVTGHHEGRVGNLVIFDPAKGLHETEGVVQQIPGRGRQVEPRIEDKLTEHDWPKFLHPWPLSENYFLVSCKPAPDSLWGIYLVDVFDNMVLLKEQERGALLEPIPLRPRPKPPVIPEKVKTEQKDALVYMADVYQGPGLRGVPRGTVKKLRVYTYHFGYQKIAGIDNRVGADGPWEVKRVLGTVPVEADGSALFRIPANRPVTVQPLDAEGKALQLMRSWLTAMPGETVSCIGCHQRQSTSPPTNQTIALQKPPSELAPWHGPERGFSFMREVQPVLDKYCVSCHDGRPDDAGKTIVDLRADQNAFVCYKGGDPKGEVVRGVPREQLIREYGGVFDPSYIALRSLVRVGGLESDLHVLPPKEFHADTSELFQMLKKGHYNVRLDDEAWDRLITWVDLNAPCHGTWSELCQIPGKQRERRLMLRRLYGGVDEDDELLPPDTGAPKAATPVIPAPAPSAKSQPVALDGWPLSKTIAASLQKGAGAVARAVDLGGGVRMEFVRIPAGTFVMGDPAGFDDEQPPAPVRIARPFWMSKYEVTNEQYRRFDPTHDSRFEHRSSWIFSEEYLGWPLNRPRQPVVRVSWNEAEAFCRWLSDKLGEPAQLPTEAQWEYACRAGTATPLSFGGLSADFSRFANLADWNIRNYAYEGWRPKSPDLVPRDPRFDDGALVSTEVGRYQPNVWGLYDMHGNAAEWTRTTYRPYPYRPEDGRDVPAAEGAKVVRGGSWYDRPARARSAFRLTYPRYQKVYNVGFRPILEDVSKRMEVAATENQRQKGK